MIFFKHKYLPYLTLFILVLLSRLPFLWAGYGIEEDSWGIALEAYNSHTSGIFEPSRLPGHPVQELFFTAIWGSGNVVFNFTCTFFSAIAVVFFALILNHFKFKYYFLAALAFAFVPVFFISSTYTIDFTWSEAFVLISLYLLLKEQLIFSGILLGLAIGCRITSGAMLIPFLIIIWQQNIWKINFLNLIKLSIPMGLVAIISFIPIIQKYGFSFFMYYDQFPYPSQAKFIYKLIFGVWGFVGTVSIGICLFLVFFNRKAQVVGSLFENVLNKKIILASIVVLILFFISYIRLPQKSGYMIPVIPFVILLFGYYLNAKNFKFLCIALIVSPFLCSINLTDKLRGAEYSEYAITYNVSGQELFFDVFSGPVFSDYSKRKQKLKYTSEVITYADKIKVKTVIIAGWWYNEIMVEHIGISKNALVVFESYINQDKMNEYIQKKCSIYYLPEQNLYNDLMFKMDVTDLLAKPFVLIRY